MSKLIEGRCLCGAVSYQVKDEFVMFHLCHCRQCQQTSGTAYAANAFTAPENFAWLSGEALIQRYDVPGRSISKAFCRQCGCGVPYIVKSGRFALVPVGTLDEQPAIKPQDHIFWHERMPWLEESHNAGKFDGFPQ